MQLRLSILYVLGLLLGCASGDLTGNDRATSDGAGHTLTIEGTGSSVAVMPGATVELAVRYVDETRAPVSGVTVDFTLTGMASGASLKPPQVVTDLQGVARTLLHAGSTPGTLQVRAATADAKPVYVMVLVGEALAAELKVGLAYAGARALASYTIAAFDGVRCEHALTLDSAEALVHRVESLDEEVHFELAPGFSTAIVAWGSDETGAPLARGCSEALAPVSGEREAPVVNVDVTLRDTSLELGGSTDIELGLNVASVMKRLSDTAARAVQRAVSPEGRYAMFGEADLYLDAIAAELAARSSADAGTKLEAARASSTLSASLAPALTKAAVGPSALAAEVAAQLADRGSLLALSSSLAGAALGPVRAWSAHSRDGSRMIALSEPPPVSLRASFDQARAELTVSELRVELGLGRYGKTLLQALRGEDERAFDEALADAAGCSTVVAPWAETQLVGICARECAVAACQRMVSELASAIEQGLGELDAPGQPLTLSGSVAVHDRTNDGLVDDLGPASLGGSWGSDKVSGELREPSRNALAL